MTQTIAIIPARAGSKGLPRKNILPLNGVPLIGHTINAAMGCKKIDRVVVTSDGDEILAFGKSANAECINRPEELARDETPTDPVIQHALQVLKLYDEDAVVVLLQPTSPLRNAAHITEALDLYKKSDCDAVIGVRESSDCPFKAFGTDGNGYLSGYFGAHAPFSRRQDFPEVCFANGAIYIFSVGSFRASGDKIPRSRALPYRMSQEASIDIDNLQDLRLAEFYLNGGLNG